MTLLTHQTPKVVSSIPESNFVEVSQRVFVPGIVDLEPTANGRKRWTRDDCAFLEVTGRLRGRYELLNGEIVSKTGQNAPHARTVMRLIAFALSLSDEDHVRTQATMEVRVEDRIANRPEPDVLMLREGTETKRTPDGSDALLIVEVADTTQSDDLGWKPGLYARAGVAEYWVVDLPRRVFVVFRSPNRETGEWADIREMAESDTIACEATPNVTFGVRDLLP